MRRRAENRVQSPGTLPPPPLGVKPEYWFRGQTIKVIFAKFYFHYLLMKAVEMHSIWKPGRFARSSTRTKSKRNQLQITKVSLYFPFLYCFAKFRKKSAWFFRVKMLFLRVKFHSPPTLQLKSDHYRPSSSVEGYFHFKSEVRSMRWTCLIQWNSLEFLFRDFWAITNVPLTIDDS